MHMAARWKPIDGASLHLRILRLKRICRSPRSDYAEEPRLNLRAPSAVLRHTTIYNVSPSWKTAAQPAAIMCCYAATDHLQGQPKMKSRGTTYGFHVVCENGSYEQFPHKQTK